MKSGPLLLCLDLGTSACKGALIDADGRTAASARETYPLLADPDGVRVEQDPETLWEGVSRVVARLVEENRSKGGAPIAAVGLSAQMSTHLLVDSSDRPLTRFLSWADRRAGRESQELAAEFGPDRLRAAYGATLSPGSSWPVPRLKWWSRNEPALLERARYLIQPKDWIVWRMTGRWASDLSSLRGLRHQETGAVDAELAAWAGFTPSLALPILPPDAVAGTLLPPLARQWGLPASVPVIVGTNDLAAAVLGAAGFPAAPLGLDITGTSEHLGVYFPAGANPVAPSQLSDIPLFGGHRLRYGVTSSSGRTLQWYWNTFRKKTLDAPGYAALEAEAASVAAGAEGLLFLPCLDGERAPSFHPNARGAFAGMASEHRPAHFSRAVLEGIAFTLRSIRDRLGVETAPASYRVLGGGGAMALWNRIKADVLGAPVTVLETSEAGCLGAAILAARALGWHATLEAAGTKMIRTGKTFVPRRDAVAAYDACHTRFEKLYRALSPLWDQDETSSPKTTL